MRLRKWLCVAAAMLCFVPACSAVDLSRAWWNPKWLHRQMVVADATGAVDKITFGSATILTEGKSKPDGSDIRVVDPDFRKLPSRVSPIARDGTTVVEFGLGPKICEHYFIYYGNPDAQMEPCELPEAQSSLLLEMRSYRGRGIRTMQDFKRVFDSSTEVMGKGYRQQIQDEKNPFSESSPRCLAMYSALFSCSRSGVYGFQFQGTGAAFLVVDDKTIVEQQLATGAYATNDNVFLAKGSHKLEFLLHSRHPLDYIARVNWKPPGADEFVPMSRKVFSSGLDFTPASVEEFGQVLSAKFTYSAERGVRFGVAPPSTGSGLLTRVRFNPIVVSGLGVKTHVRWEFGDGTESREDEPMHTYQSEGTFRVKMTAKDECGFTQSCSKDVVLTPADAVNVVAKIYVRADTNLIPYLPDATPGNAPGAPPPVFSLDVSFDLSSPEQKDFDFDCSVIKEGATVESHTERITLYPGDVVVRETAKRVARTLNVPNYPGRFKARLSLRYRQPTESPGRSGEKLESASFEAARRDVNVLLDTDAFPEIASYDTNLTDAEGNLVILKQTSPQKAPTVNLGTILHRREVPLRILVVDNSLAPEATGIADGMSFYRILSEELERRYNGLRVELRRAATERDELGHFPLKRIFETAKQVEKFRPDVIVLSCDLQDILSFSPESKMRTLYGVMVNHLLTCSRAKIVLVTPPPYPFRGEESKVLSIVLEKLALGCNLAVADLFSAIMLSKGDWKQLFLDDARQDEVYNMYLNTAGQRIIADVILRSILENTG